MDYEGRLQRFRQQMATAGVNVAFLPISADLAYLTGVPRDMPNFGATLYNGRWLEGAFITQDAGPVMTLPRMTAELHLEGLVSGDVRVLRDQDDPASLARDVLHSFHLPERPIVALGNFGWAETAIRLQQLLPDARFVSATDLLRPLRRIKDADDLDVLRRAGAVTEAAFADVLTHLKHGMTESEISSEVDYQMKKHGAFGPSFTTAMYNSGPNHKLGLGHANTSRNEPLVAPISLLFDFGAAFENYCYDYGRTVFFGDPPAEMQKVYDTIMTAQRAGINALKAGSVTCEEVDRAARAVVVEAGYGPNFRHRLGHGIGMDVHEPPFLMETDTTPVEEGMCFTIEPSILNLDGYSARVEDIIVARPAGGEPLTTGYQSLIVI